MRSDAGAFYYHNPRPFKNYQEALLAVKADAEARHIPFRYSQWYVVKPRSSRYDTPVGFQAV